VTPLLALAINLLGLGGVAMLFRAGPPDVFTLAGWQALIACIFPVLLLAEVLFLICTYRKVPRMVSRALKLPLLIYAAHAVFAAYLRVDVLDWTASFFSSYALFESAMSPLGFVYAYVVWELGHFVHHWSCHKVRLFWCLHAPHHTPEHMNLSVAHANFLYQGLHATFIRTALCAASGVPMPMLLLVMVIDGCWGSLIHVSEEVWKGGRLPSLFNRVFLSPVHHRVHHASNPEYIDKNFCNTLPLWDKLFGTFQDELPGVALRYGLTRPVKVGSFTDLYFGEIRLLLRDMAQAHSVRNALAYVVMPPGWRPTCIRTPVPAPHPLSRCEAKNTAEPSS
jgi:sterol desaturase/sphingolipid hydroxylase (fatty acid hydroxylase superfamily)